MIIGHIVGRVTTTRFEVSITHEVKKFEYLQVHHRSYGFVLCQLVEIIKEHHGEVHTKGICVVLGYIDPEGTHRMIREPFEPNTEVLLAQDSFIADVVKLKEKSKEAKDGKEKGKQGAYLGMLEGREIKIQLDLQKLLTKHVAILAKSGAGKSYCVGVLLEEIMDHGVPLLVIDPHGEYQTLRNKSDEQSPRMQKFGVEPKTYLRKIKLYGDPKVNPECAPLTLSDQLDTEQILHLLPKLSATQEAVLHNAAKSAKNSIEGLMGALDLEESPVKFAIIHHLQHLLDSKLFSNAPISLNEFIQVNRCSIVNLRGIPPEFQEIIVFKLLSDVFEARKKGSIPPFFCVIEEAHNFCPEKNFGASKASAIIRTVASEGRKFGMGLGIISQRPARVEKSVLSQITTQIILKVTNPNDLKAVVASVEGLTSESATEIQNLPVGTGLVTGVVDMPLFVNIRPRKTKHGGEAVDILEQTRGSELFEEIKEFSEAHIIPLIEPTVTKGDMQIMHPGSNIITVQVPAALFSCQNSTNATPYNLLVELQDGRVVTDIATFATKELPNIDELTPRALKVLEKSYFLKKFTFEDFISQTGFGMDCKLDLEELVKKKYVLFDAKTKIYNINENIILSKLSSYACYVKPNYKASPGEKKGKKNVTLDSMKTKLTKFASVVSVQDCWIIKYEVA